MAWTCSTCSTEVAIDTEACPGCGSLKASWTVVPESTRTFALELKRFELWRGEATDPVAAGSPEAAPGRVAVSSAEEVVALAKSKVAALAGQGLAPAPRHQLVLRTFPRGDKRPTAVVTIPYARDAARELELPREAPELTNGAFDQAFVFVFGPGDPPVVESLHVIDVTDADAPGGHVDHVVVSGFKKKKGTRLPVRAEVARRRFVFSR